MADFTVVRGEGGDLREDSSVKTLCVRQEPRRNSPAVPAREVEGRQAFRFSILGRMTAVGRWSPPTLL